MPGEELDVVEQQEVDELVALAELVDLIRRERPAQLLDEVLERRVLDVELPVHLHRVGRDRAHEVRLAEAGAAVDEQRVVHRPRRLRDRVRGRRREPIGRADDEVVEPVPTVERHSATWRWSGTR
jgi:hypothetical protein